MFQQHLKAKYPTEVRLDTTQQQLHKYGNPNIVLFHLSEKKYKDELAKCISVEHLAFNFDKKLSFNNFVQNACALQAKSVPMTTLTQTIRKLNCKEKIDLQIFL